MSWLTSLAKIGGIAAAPFSGGASLALTGLGAVGDVLGKQQQGQAQGQVQQANLQQGHDRNAVDLYGTQQRAQTDAAQTDLDRKKFVTSDASANFKQALIAELLGKGTGLSMPGIPQTSGGFMDALKGEGAQAALQSFGSRAHAAQDAPPSFAGGEMLKAPTLTPLPEGSKGSGFLDILARIAQIGGAAAPLFKKQEDQ